MIVLIGNRFGFLVPLLVVLSEMGVQTTMDAFFGAGYAEKRVWIWGVGLFPAALICWLFGRWLLVPKSSPEDHHLESGSEPTVGSARYARYAMREIEKEAAFNSPRDSFFFLALYYWGPLLAVLGMVVLVVGWLDLVNFDS